MSCFSFPASVQMTNQHALMLHQHLLIIFYVSKNQMVDVFYYQMLNVFSHLRKTMCRSTAFFSPPIKTPIFLLKFLFTQRSHLKPGANHSILILLLSGFGRGGGNHLKNLQ
ncbi:hypothetical protein KSP39_PZI008283 [Platanthera zijinensis]|uniref:Uncharacterized protein n=1 Tax=Platanthera zijinensis TaxID=2320716 RepID=A0AAP0BN76_9ASPA